MDIFLCLSFPSVMSVSCSLVERPDLFALLYVMFHCAFVTFQYGVLGQVKVLDCIDA